MLLTKVTKKKILPKKITFSNLKEIDLQNPKTNSKTPGYTKEERYQRYTSI